MKTSAEISKISKAIVDAQAMVKAAVKDGKNSFFKSASSPDGSKYATIDSVIEASREALSKNRLAIIQAPSKENDVYFVMTRVQHESGEFFEIETPCIFSKNDMQGFGSAITYAKRYALSSLLNISTDDDDDGNEASKPSTDEQPTKQFKKDPYYFTDGGFKGKKFEELMPEDFNGYLSKLEMLPQDKKSKSVLDLISRMNEFKQQGSN